MIKENLNTIWKELPAGVKLVAVSKLKPADDILEAYGAGQRVFGENYATELRDKAAMLPGDIEWHFIGHLQGKQLKYYIPFVSMIHGVDSVEHLQEVEHAAAKVDRTVDVLLQVHVAQEETKFGFSPEELDNLEGLGNSEHVRVCGVMGMASNTPDTDRVRADFRRIRQVFESLKSGVFAGHPEFREVSMGMSHDYHIAVDEGSTMVRIGSSIFGPRNYQR
jgi:pyridoxal phosphate enzyme (YggS family)